MIEGEKKIYKAKSSSKKDAKKQQRLRCLPMFWKTVSGIFSMKEITFIQRIVQNSKILHFNGCFSLSII